jgi:hypothetical protein
MDWWSEGFVWGGCAFTTLFGTRLVSARHGGSGAWSAHPTAPPTRAETAQATDERRDETTVRPENVKL